MRLSIHKYFKLNLFVMIFGVNSCGPAAKRVQMIDDGLNHNQDLDQNEKQGSGSSILHDIQQCPDIPSHADKNIWQLEGVKYINETENPIFVGVLYDSVGNSSDKNRPFLNCYYKYTSEELSFSFYLKLKKNPILSFNYRPSNLWVAESVFGDNLNVCNGNSELKSFNGPVNVTLCQFNVK